jgi:hypothetical protein
MIKLNGMNNDKVEKAFKANQLDKLIHDAYKVDGATGYYKCFVTKIL